MVDPTEGVDHDRTGLLNPLCSKSFQRSGVVAEWLNAAVLKGD
jgi:hypothetical protein